MILKGSQRGGGRQMALHLLKTEANEHVEIHEVRGFIASDIQGALNEAYALSKGTQCKQYMYSLSLNPPQEENVPVSVFEDALERIEKRLGLEGQPRVIVFHEKEGRRHAHCVWSRIDIDEMKAINMAHDRRKLNDLAKALYLEHGWKMPAGFRNKSHKNPLNFTRAQWQQAARIGRKADDIKRELQECWAMSDSKKGFQNALKDTGYTLAKGDRRSYVVVDTFGEIFSLPRQLGMKAKDLEPRLGKSENLPSIEQAKSGIDEQLTPLFKKYREELAAHHEKQMDALLNKKLKMADAHRA
ncbi:MAG: relaxase/mobilization nuclease domain-containing protein [Steroidobacteraceae bacterium]